MTPKIKPIVLAGTGKNEFGIQIDLQGRRHYGVAAYAKPEGAAANIFAVTCHLRPINGDGSGVIRSSGKLLVVSHTASMEKAVHRLDAEGETVNLMQQALTGAAVKLLEEIAVEKGNEVLLVAGSVEQLWAKL
ncbi:MAG: hypothetical protein ABL934_09910 [Lysobacteraceae bacterium]